MCLSFSPWVSEIEIDPGSGASDRQTDQFAAIEAAEELSPAVVAAAAVVAATTSPPSRSRSPSLLCPSPRTTTRGARLRV